MFVDDIAPLTTSKKAESLEIVAFISINMVQKYCDITDLISNECKTKLMTLGRHKNVISRPPNLTMT